MGGNEADGATSAKPRRRRSVGKAKGKPAAVGLLGWVRTAQFGRVLLAVMLVLTAGYVWQMWRSVSLSGERLGPIALGMSADQVRAVMVPAQANQAADAGLVFEQDGRRLVVQLDGPDQRVSAISCHEQIITAPPCPALLDVRIGDPRDEVLRKVGPGRLHLNGQRERRDYLQLGASIDLHDGQVVQITLRAGPGRDRRWQMLLWRLIP